MISVIAWIGAFMFTALFCFAMCFGFEGDGGGGSREGEGDDDTWTITTDPFFDDLIRIQICATIQRLEELTYQEIQLNMRLLEEGETNNNKKLKKKLQRVTAKIEKARRRLEESRLQAEDIFISLGLGRMDNNDDTIAATAEGRQQPRRKEMPTDRKELIEKNIITIKYGLPHQTSATEEVGEETVGRSKVIVRDDVYCSTKNTSSVCEGNYCCFEANNNNDDDDDDDINDVPPCHHRGGHTDECIICLDEYQVGDILVKSKQDRCIHQFHKECMLQWLRKHEQCPLCRVRLLVVEEDEGTTTKMTMT